MSKRQTIPLRDFFPKKAFRPNQEEIINDLMQAIQSKKHVIFLQGTGGGKTLNAICSIANYLLLNETNCLIIGKTEEQNKRFLNEGMEIGTNWNRKCNEHKMLFLQIISRAKLCVNETPIEELMEDEQDVSDAYNKKCDLLIKEGKCQYYEQFREWSKVYDDETRKNRELGEGSLNSCNYWVAQHAPSVSDFLSKLGGRPAITANMLLDYCEDEAIAGNLLCPYYLCKLLLYHVNFLVCNYQWVINPNIRHSILDGTPLNLQQSYIVLDEMQNLPTISCEILTYSLSSERILATCKKVEEDIKVAQLFFKDLSRLDEIRRNHLWQNVLQTIFAEYKSNVARSGEICSSLYTILQQDAWRLVHNANLEEADSSEFDYRSTMSKILEDGLKISFKDVEKLTADLDRIERKLALPYIDPRAYIYASIVKHNPSTSDFGSILRAIRNEFKLAHDNDPKPPAQYSGQSLVRFCRHYNKFIVHRKELTGFGVKPFSESFQPIFKVYKHTGPREDYPFELEIKCHDPRLVMVPLFRESKGTLAMTGTYDPIFFHLLGYSSLDQIRDGCSFIDRGFSTEKSAFLVLCDTSITSRKKSRQEQNPEYARRISYMLDLAPRNVIVFTTSYDQTVSIYKELENLYHGPKNLLCDRRNDPSIIKKFEQAVDEKGAVLVTPIGGKYGEGADFPGHKCNCTILAGFPQPPPNATLIGREQFYHRLFTKVELTTDSRMAATKHFAYRQSAQGGGRCVRGNDDLGVVILMDDRFLDFFNDVSFPKSWNQKKYKYSGEAFGENSSPIAQYAGKSTTEPPQTVENLIIKHYNQYVTRIVDLDITITELTDEKERQETISKLLDLYEQYAIKDLREYFPKSEWDSATTLYQKYKQTLPVETTPSDKIPGKDFKDHFRTLFPDPFSKVTIEISPRWVHVSILKDQDLLITAQISSPNNDPSYTSDLIINKAQRAIIHQCPDESGCIGFACMHLAGVLKHLNKNFYDIALDIIADMTGHRSEWKILKSQSK